MPTMMNARLLTIYLLFTTICILPCHHASAQTGNILYNGIYTMHSHGTIIPDNKPLNFDDAPKVDTVYVYNDCLVFNDMQAKYMQTISNGNKVYACSTDDLDFAFQMSPKHNLFIFFAPKGSNATIRAGFYHGDQRKKVTDEIADRKLILTDNYTGELISVYFDFPNNDINSIDFSQMTPIESSAEPAFNKIEIWGRHLMVGNERYNYIMGNTDNGWNMFVSTNGGSCILATETGEVIKLIMDKQNHRLYATPYLRGDKRAQVKAARTARHEATVEQQRQNQLRQHNAIAQRQKQRQEAIQLLSNTLVDMLNNISRAFNKHIANPQWATTTQGGENSNSNNPDTQLQQYKEHLSPYKYYTSTTGVTKGGDRSVLHIYVNRKNTQDFRVTYGKYDAVDRNGSLPIHHTRASDEMPQSYYITTYGVTYYFNF